MNPPTPLTSPAFEPLFGQNRSLNEVYTQLDDGLELLRLSWVMQIHEGALEMILLHQIYPRLAILHADALRNCYATGKLMLPNVFIATFTGERRPQDSSGSLSTDESVFWKGHEDMLSQAIEHPTNRRKVVEHIRECEQGGKNPDRRPSFYKAFGRPSNAHAGSSRGESQAEVRNPDRAAKRKR